MEEKHNVTQFKYQLSVTFVHSTQPLDICTRDNHRLNPGGALLTNETKQQHV